METIKKAELMPAAAAAEEDEGATEKELLTVGNPHGLEVTETDPPPDPYATPDGGWGWVVVAACVLGHFLMVGISRGFGVFYVVLLEKFGGSAQATAWVHALYNTGRMVTGPLVSRLCDRFTIRKVIIVGAIIQGIGCIVSAFATSLVYLYFSYGVLNGIGGGLIFTPMIIAISQYFEKNKGKAMALATLGSGFGSVAFAPLATLLLQEYSWTGAMLIIGAMMFHNIAVGMVMRPLPKPPKSTAAANGKAMEMQEDGEKEEEDSELQGCFSKLCRRCRESEGLKMLRSSTYLLYCVSMISLPFCTQLTFLMTPSLARERGLTDSQAAWILSIMGISDMTGRFAHGFLFDLSFIRGRRRALFCLLGMMLGAINATFALASSFPTFIAVAIVWGLTEGGFHGQRATVQGEFVPKSQISKTVGNMIFCEGVGNLLAPTIGGTLVDAVGTFRISFVFGGCVTLTGATLFLMDFIFGAKIKEWCCKQNK